MVLSSYCSGITQDKQGCRDRDTDFGPRVMCPEYSTNHIDVKVFPQEFKGDMFALLWNIKAGGHLSSAILPNRYPLTYQYDFKPELCTQLHTHDYIELAYIVEGKFRQQIMGKDILFKKGELCLIDKNCPHKDFLDDDDSIVLFIGLGNDIFDEVMIQNIGEEKILDFLRTALMKQKDIQQYLHFKPKNQEQDRLEQLLYQFLKEMETNDIASGFISRGVFMRIIHYISTQYEFNLSNEVRNKMKWIIYEEVTKYITNHYSDVTVRDLVDKFHFNGDYYNRLLKDKAGVTYVEYLQEIRLKNAHRLLKNTDLSVDEVAEQVGYQNKGYFYKIFMNKYGVTPAKARR